MHAGKRNTFVRVDSRTVSFTNKKQIEAWIEEYGEDSDYRAVRVKGEFPRAGYANFISPELVGQACAGVAPTADVPVRTRRSRRRPGALR